MPPFLGNTSKYLLSLECQWQIKDLIPPKSSLAKQLIAGMWVKGSFQECGGPPNTCVTTKVPPVMELHDGVQPLFSLLPEDSCHPSLPKTACTQEAGGSGGWDFG